MVRRAAYAVANELLSPMKAWEVVRPYWLDIVRTFEDKGFAEPGRVRVEMDPKWHDSCRHYAAMTTDGRAMFFAPAMADLPPDNIKGVLAHEAGHLVDYQNPGRYWYRPASAVNVREGSRVVSVLDVDPATKEPVLFKFEQLPSKALAKHMRDWDERPRDEVEMCADAIASYAVGKQIGYTGEKECLIQSLGSGVPRPKGTR